MTHRSSDRIAQVQTPVIPVVGEWIKQHPGTISLGQGIVHYGPPDSVRAAVHRALDDDPRIDRYGLVRGIDDLLVPISDKLARENRLLTGGDATIVVTSGSNMGFLNAVLAIADVEDEIIVLSPYYFNHQMAIEIAGCRAVAVPTDATYGIDMAAIEEAITDRTRAVVTVSPNNPTGAVYPRDTLQLVNALCATRGIYHISDEAYEYFVYDSEHWSPGSLPGASAHTISLFTFSKAYGMAGWRVGYMVIPTPLENAVKKIQDTNLVCPPIVNQLAAAAALAAGRTWCEQQTARFSDVRDLVLAELATLGDRCHVPVPNGAFYALLQLATDQDEMALVQSLIRDHGVAVLPGGTFGVESGCSVRIAYGALDADTVANGMQRLVRGLASLIS